MMTYDTFTSTPPCEVGSRQLSRYMVSKIGANAFWDKARSNGLSVDAIVVLTEPSKKTRWLKHLRFWWMRRVDLVLS
jgi:hypothetical protein